MSNNQKHTTPMRQLTFAVYAPLGDPALANFPDDRPKPLHQHRLFTNLCRVAAQNINVVALIDYADQGAFLVEIPAGNGNSPRIVSRWKLLLNSPITLCGFLEYAQSVNPCARLILSLEGHGSGYVPDSAQLAGMKPKLSGPWNITRNGNATRDGVTGAPQFENPDSMPEHFAPLPESWPVLPESWPVLPESWPVLPESWPVLPGMPMSTYQIGEALSMATAHGVNKLAVVNLDNCYNFTIETTSTIAPYAEYATGYMNYNFFTAGDAYPSVFAELQSQHDAVSHADLARAFAKQNHAVLNSIEGHPTVGSAIDLSRMDDLMQKVDALSLALIAALPAGIKKITEAIHVAGQFDTTTTGKKNARDFVLEVPDDLTDLRTFANNLIKQFGSAHTVARRAHELSNALNDVKVYGDRSRPYVNPGVTWDFTDTLAMSIFLPNPRRQDVWDWRTPFYLASGPNLTRQITFLTQTHWPDFLRKYHADTPFIGVRAPSMPRYPKFDVAAPKIIAAWDKKHPQVYKRSNDDKSQSV